MILDFDNKKKKLQWMIGFFIVCLIILVEQIFNDDMPYTSVLFFFWLLTGQFALDSSLWIGRQIRRLFKR